MPQDKIMREVEDGDQGVHWTCTVLGRITDDDGGAAAEAYELVMCLGGGPFTVLKLHEGELAQLSERELVRRIENERHARDRQSTGH